MGLDLVELLFTVEDEFAIKISDDEAAAMVSVGNMYDHIIEKLQQRGAEFDKSDVWNRLKVLIVDQLGVKPEEITRTAEFVRDFKAE
jgi:acyl carrier protein